MLNSGKPIFCIYCHTGTLSRKPYHIAIPCGGDDIPDSKSQASYEIRLPGLARLQKTYTSSVEFGGKARCHWRVPVRLERIRCSYKPPLLVVIAMVGDLSFLV